MQLKSGTYKVLLLLVCINWLMVQAVAMQLPNERIETCVQCNNFNVHVQSLQCDHTICVPCMSKINDENANLGIPGICKVCQFIYKTGSVVTDNKGQPINKLLFNPALKIPSSVHIPLMGALTSLVGYKIGSCIWGNTTNAARLTGVTSGVLSTFFYNHLAKRAIIYESLKAARKLKHQAPVLSRVMELRLKLFEKKHLLYSCVAVVPSIALFYFISHRMQKQMQNNDTVGFGKNARTIVGSMILPVLALDMWGSRYDSIPKLK